MQNHHKYKLVTLTNVHAPMHTHTHTHTHTHSSDTRIKDFEADDLFCYQTILSGSAHLF